VPQLIHVHSYRHGNARCIMRSVTILCVVWVLLSDSYFVAFVFVFYFFYFWPPRRSHNEHVHMKHDLYSSYWGFSPHIQCDHFFEIDERRTMSSCINETFIQV